MLTEVRAGERASESELKPWRNAAHRSHGFPTGQGSPPLRRCIHSEPCHARPDAPVPSREGQRVASKGGSASAAPSLRGAVPPAGALAARTRGWSGGSPRLVPPRAGAGGGARDPRSRGSGAAGGTGQAGTGGGRWHRHILGHGPAAAGSLHPCTSPPALLWSVLGVGRESLGRLAGYLPSCEIRKWCCRFRAGPGCWLPCRGGGGCSLVVRWW